MKTRDLMSVRAAGVRMAAALAGWRRDAKPVMLADGTGPFVVWHGPQDRVLLFEDPEVLPPGLCHLQRARLITGFEGKCRLCGAQGHSVNEDEVASVDRERVEVQRTVDLLDVAADRDPTFYVRDWFAIEHAADCPLRPVWPVV